MSACQVAFVLELCRCSLYRYLHHFGSIHEAERVAWSHQMCIGLKHIHECSVIHRDLKPDNLLLQRSPGKADFLKIGDFGNSCIVVKDSGKRPRPAHLTELAKGITTYQYAAPEILKSEPYEFSSDVWSAGVVIYELVQENPARPAIQCSKGDTMEIVLSKTLTFLHEVAQLDTGLGSALNSDIPDLKLVQEMLREAYSDRPCMQDILNRAGFCPITSWGIAAADGLKQDGSADRTPGSRQGDLLTELGGSGAPEELLAGGTPEGVDLNRLPEIVLLAREAWKLLSAMVPADITVFFEVVESLGQHSGSLLLQLMLAMAKYPTSVRIMGKHFQELPAKLTPASLTAACHKCILEVGVINGGEIYRQEVLIFDDQRMATCMGFPRVMEQFGFLRNVTHAPQVSGRTVKLGRGKPPMKYKLTSKQHMLKRFMNDLDGLQLKLPDRISNTIIIEHADALSAFGTILPKMRRGNQAAAKHAKPKQAKKRLKLPASGHLAKKTRIKLMCAKPLRRCWRKGSHLSKRRWAELGREKKRRGKFKLNCCFRVVLQILQGRSFAKT